MVQSQINTSNEYLLRNAMWVQFQQNALTSPQIVVQHNGISQLVAQLVAGEPPCDKPKRNVVGHKDCVTTNNTVNKVHWVSSAFNHFNRLYNTPISGYQGVIQTLPRHYQVYFQQQNQGHFRDAQVAAAHFNRLARVEYSNMLDGVPGFLNDVLNINVTAAAIKA
ncbi:uncharacterized protein PSFLO_02195 [Pseudozyma flocculosa]|uniref:Uncharacterized protein n=1 Tax=Pseudozyma flocculosa TaxID=84751 RepID=A0A5C3EWW0_9BASI|nr:uncharacterized protein PSFLO_02195 [Pseudozyma flocculosa]